MFTDPQAASVGDTDGEITATAPIASGPRTSTYTRAYAKKNGFLTLVSDGERLIGAYALGPDAGEWLQATVAIRAGVPLAVMNDVIQPFPTFSEIFLALTELESKVSSAVYGSDGRGQRSMDPLGEDGTFVVCSFWLAFCLAEAGEVKRAGESSQGGRLR